MPRVSFFAKLTAGLSPTLLLSLLSTSALAQITGQPPLQPVSVPQVRGLAQPQTSSQTNGQINSQYGSSPIAAASSSAMYILGAGDQISLSVIGYPEFTGTLAVLSDGTITLPLVGPVRAS
ncbi:MAG: polysaccharide biosynthesis/export family protein, partial [Phormidesmis sp.]